MDAIWGVGSAFIGSQKEEPFRQLSKNRPKPSQIDKGYFPAVSWTEINGHSKILDAVYWPVSETARAVCALSGRGLVAHLTAAAGAAAGATDGKYFSP